MKMMLRWVFTLANIIYCNDLRSETNCSDFLSLLKTKHAFAQQTFAELQKTANQPECDGTIPGSLGVDLDGPYFRACPEQLLFQQIPKALRSSKEFKVWVIASGEIPVDLPSQWQGAQDTTARFNYGALQLQLKENRLAKIDYGISMQSFSEVGIHHLGSMIYLSSWWSEDLFDVNDARLFVDGFKISPPKSFNKTAKNCAHEDLPIQCGWNGTKKQLAQGVISTWWQPNIKYRREIKWRCEHLVKWESRIVISRGKITQIEVSQSCENGHSIEMKFPLKQPARLLFAKAHESSTLTCRKPAF